MGERPSKTALERGWRWQHGRLAAKQLFDALTAIGINPSKQRYVNLFRTSLEKEHELETRILSRLKKLSRTTTIVAMGKRVAANLIEAGIIHLAITQPAARGRIRKKARYREHLQEILLSGY